MNSIRLIVLYLSSLFFITTARSLGSENDPNYIAISVADGPFVIGDMHLLSGYKTNVIKGENPLRSKVFEGNVTTYKTPRNSFNVKFVGNKFTQTDVMDFEGELTANFIILTASAQGKYYKEKVTTKNEFKLIYRAEMEAYRKKIAGDIIPVWLKGEEKKLSADEIAEKYGTKYIKEIVYGAELDLVHTIRFRKDVDISKFEAKFEACITFICINVEFNKAEESSSEDYTQSLSAQLTGMDFPIPTNPTFSEVEKFIEDFQSEFQNYGNKSIEAINNETNVLKKLSPIGIVLGRISDESSISDEIDESFRDLDINIKNSTKVLTSALLLKEKLIATRDRQKILYLDPRDKRLLFIPYNDAVESVLKDINAKIKECLEYQRLPLEENLGRDFPEEYNRNETVLEGLLGEIYLPENVTVGMTTFIDMHYSGFAILVDGVIKPWLSGAIRLDEIDDETNDYKVVASATRPEDLERLAFENIIFDESKVRIRAAHAIGSLFQLGEWTNTNFVNATNLQQFEFLNIGSLFLEVKASYNVTGLGAEVWTTSQVGESGSEAKKIEKFALRILKPGTKSGDDCLNEHYSVEYKAKFENGEETPFCKDGEWCGGGNSGNGISAIYVIIVKKPGKAPCDEVSPCHCELSICYKP